MSKEAIESVVQELESLPDADQQLVLNFLATLKARRHTVGARSSSSESNSALLMKGSLLVFTGTIDAPNADWVRLVRDERDEELMGAALGWTPRS